MESSIWDTNFGCLIVGMLIASVIWLIVGKVEQNQRDKERRNFNN